MNGDDLRRALSGDAVASEALGAWLDHELHRFFARSFKNREHITELVQATTLTVLVKADCSPADPRAFRSWVRGIAGMTATAARGDIARERERKRLAKLALEMTVPSRSPSSTLAHEERCRLVERYVPRLATPYRQAVENKLSGVTAKQAAADDGIADGTARWRYIEAVRQVQAMIENDRVTPRQHTP